MNCAHTHTHHIANRDLLIACVNIITHLCIYSIKRLKSPTHFGPLANHLSRQFLRATPDRFNFASRPIPTLQKDSKTPPRYVRRRITHRHTSKKGEREWTNASLNYTSAGLPLRPRRKELFSIGGRKREIVAHQAFGGMIREPLSTHTHTPTNPPNTRYIDRKHIDGDGI